MNVFIINKSQDYESAQAIVSRIREKCFSFNPLILRNTNAFWKIDAAAKIRKCQLVIVFIGEHTHESPYVAWEIERAIRNDKRIVSIMLDESFTVPPSLIRSDPFSGMSERVDECMDETGLEKLIVSYEKSDYQVLNGELADIDRADLLEQYKIYLQTSEDLVNRRQSVNNFYSTANTALVTIFGSVLAINPNKEMSLFIGFCFAILGIVLCLSWARILKAYGNLNASKMKVISILEKQLPASLYDAEWSVMSDRLNKQKYISFTDSEKRVPRIFIVIYIIIFIVSVSLYFS